MNICLIMIQTFKFSNIPCEKEFKNKPFIKYRLESYSSCMTFPSFKTFSENY